MVLVSDEDKEPCCDCTTCVNATTIEVYSGSGGNGRTSVAFTKMLFLLQLLVQYCSLYET